MRSFSLDTKPLLTPEVVALLTEIYECKGKQTLYIEAQPDVLTTMLQTAKIQSIGASNRLEGIHTSDQRLIALMNEKDLPRNRSEEEIAGYRKVLDTIHESYDYIPIKPSILLQLHRDLYSYGVSSNGGSWKNTNNAIVQERESGEKFVRFQPLSALETPEAMERLCDSYTELIQNGKGDPLLLSLMFVLDFLCIHPFNDGNGRMSRLLTLLMLYRSDYIVGKYISIETLIEKSRESYYETLYISSQEWHEGKNAYEPFVRYMLGIILLAYREFISRVEYLRDKKISKPERIRQLFTSRLEPLRRQEISELCPDISTATIKNTLTELVKEGYIIKLGAARATTYIKNME